MELHYKEEVRVGALVLVALAIFIAGFMWLSGRQFGAKGVVVVPVRFEDVAGLRVGDPVQVSGYKVGTVGNVVLQDVGNVMVYLDVNRNWRPHSDAKAFVTALDFFGAKYVNYVPGHAPEMLTEGQVITGTREAALTETATGLSDQAAGVLTGLQNIVTPQTASDIHQTMVAVQRALNVMSRLGEGPGVNDATNALKAVERLAIKLDSALANPAVSRSASQLDSVTANLNRATQQLATASVAINSLLAKVDSNQGTLGRVVNDTTMYHDLNEMSKSIKLLLDDIRERPGRYFNLKVF